MNVNWNYTHEFQVAEMKFKYALHHHHQHNRFKWMKNFNLLLTIRTEAQTRTRAHISIYPQISQLGNRCLSIVRISQLYHLCSCVYAYLYTVGSCVQVFSVFMCNVGTPITSKILQRSAMDPKWMESFEILMWNIEINWKRDRQTVCLSDRQIDVQRE